MTELQEKRKELEEYILGEHLSKVFPLLTYQIILAEARSELIKESTEKFRMYLVDTENSSMAERLFIKLHATQLDLISKMFMLMEDYLIYSYFLRNNKKELPYMIMSNTMGLGEKEIRHLRDLDKEGLSKYLLLPTTDRMPLSDDDKKFVQEALDDLSEGVRTRINEITRFYDNYYRVYIRYKHIFSAVIGTYSDEQNKKIPRIFIRDRNKRNDYTYVLPSNIETLQYYEKLNDDLTKVFLILLECHIHYIQNCGKPFLVPNVFFLAGEKKERWLEIVKRVNSYTGIQPLTVRINVKEDIRQRMLNAFLTEYIFRWDKDFFEHEENTIKNQ